MSKPLTGFYEATKYLGQFVGEKVKFLQVTSCMDPETREIMALLEAIKPYIEKEDLEMFEFAKHFFELIGFARWQRDTVTDMALRKGSPSETERWEDEKVDDATNIQDSSEDVLAH